MEANNLSFNILTFNHPEEELTFWFSDTDDKGLMRVHKNLVPDEVINYLGERNHYYTSFTKEHKNFLAVSKLTKPVYESYINNEGEKKWKKINNSAFTRSLLKRYYNTQIHNHFKGKGHLVKPNFINDTEIWLPNDNFSSEYRFFEKYTIKVQIARITKQPELLITYEGTSKVFRKSLVDFMPDIDPSCFNWVIFNSNLYKFDKLPEDGKQNYENVYPVLNFKLRNALQQQTPPPDRSNKYIKFKDHIDRFYQTYLNTDEFKKIIPLDSNGFLQVDELKINHVNDNSNQLVFKDGHKDNIPYKGIKKGPYKTPDFARIQFFFIFHDSDKDVAKLLHGYFTNGINSFNGIQSSFKVPYFTKEKFSIAFSNLTNPLPEIEDALSNRNFDPETHYMAIYVSHYSKQTRNKHNKNLYYKVKEILLKRGITSQTIEAAKVRNDYNNKKRYDFSLNNIALAILAKLNGIPWQLNTKLKKELIVGVGAFKNLDTNVRYIGSAFSFSNNGKFNRFECFHNNQIVELAGSIINQVKEFVAVNSNMDRLVIHFYKNMSYKELKPIEDGLNDLGLDIPVFIVSINKTESNDIVAFDNNWNDLMPLSGLFINIGNNHFLLFNNTRYSLNSKFNSNDGYPFPIKLKIRCTDEELIKDYKIIKELIDQVYQFSRMYWKSLRQQNLPVTIKYPEMVAEMFPYFEGHEIPEFGKDNLWFL